MTRRTTAARAMDDVAAALPAWVCARLVVFAALAFGYFAFNRLHPGAIDAVRLHEGLLGWDGQWYRRIAAHGYAAIPREALRFFPLYPLLGRAGRLVPGVGSGAALLAVANVSALGLGALLHRLVLVERADHELARRAAWLVAIVPPEFVLAMAYPEGLAGCLAVGVFLSMRTGRWPVAIGCAFLAGLMRPVGAFLAVPMAIEAARALKVERRAALRRLLAAAAPLAGTGVYLGWVGARFGNALLPLQLQQQSYLRGGVANPLLALVRSGRDLMAGTMEPNGMHFAWAVVFVLLVLAAFRHWPASYGAFAAVSLVAALSAQRLGSLERYGFGAFPIVLALASLTARPWADRASLVLSGAGLFAYANLAFLNIYVP